MAATSCLFSGLTERRSALSDDDVAAAATTGDDVEKRRRCGDAGAACFAVEKRADAVALPLLPLLVA